MSATHKDPVALQKFYKVDLDLLRDPHLVRSFTATQARLRKTEEAVLRMLPWAGGTLVDVGAHLGELMFAVHRKRPHTEIVSVEAAELHARYIRHRIVFEDSSAMELNPGHLRSVHTAAGAEVKRVEGQKAGPNRTVTLQYTVGTEQNAEKGSPVVTFQAPSDCTAGGGSIQCQQGDFLLSSLTRIGKDLGLGTISVIRINMKGLEREVLHGARSLLKHSCPSLPVILIETLGRSIDAVIADAGNELGWLYRRGYERVKIKPTPPGVPPPVLLTLLPPTVEAAASRGFCASA